MRSAASACGPCSASRPATRSARRSRTCCRPRPRSSSCTRSRSCTTTCRRSTTTRAPRRAVGLGAVRRGDGDPRRRRAARRGDAARAHVPDRRGRARARRGDARDDRRPAARPRRRRAARRPALAEDGRALLGVGRCARSGRPSVPVAEQAPWREFAAELGLLFQIVDDLLDGDGYVLDGGRGRRAAARRRGRGPRAGAARRRSTPTRACSPRSSTGCGADVVAG